MTPSEPDFESFPLLRKGNRFEEFTPEREFAHHWGRTITASDNVLFSTAMCNWNPMHLNGEYARAHGHAEVVVNPMLVLCTTVGLSVEDLSEAGGPFLGMDEVVFHQPVYPGDTITARSRVVSAVESQSRPTSGIVTWRTEARNQRGELVVSYRRTNLVAKGSSS